LRRNALQTHVIEENIQKRYKGREDEKEDVGSYRMTKGRIYWKLKEEALGGNYFGRGYGPPITRITW
jgi:hypothetical protein